MKEFLTDLVAHTHNLGFLPLIKITASDQETLIESMSLDKSVILLAKSHKPIEDLNGTFGLLNLNKLDLHLKCPEYKENSKIKVMSETKNGEKILTGLHFENENKDFQNNYRFMIADIINEKLKTVTFKGVKWDIQFTPKPGSVQRLRFQAAAHTEETVFNVSTEKNDLIFSFGNESTHAGKFVFHPNVTGKLKYTWAWPIAHVQSILNLPGDVTMMFSDAGALQISVNSMFAKYDYILPAMTK